jgi:hypothetical protein
MKIFSPWLAGLLACTSLENVSFYIFDNPNDTAAKIKKHEF